MNRGLRPQIYRQPTKHLGRKLRDVFDFHVQMIVISLVELIPNDQVNLAQGEIIGDGPDVSTPDSCRGLNSPPGLMQPLWCWSQAA